MLRSRPPLFRRCPHVFKEIASCAQKVVIRVQKIAPPPTISGELRDDLCLAWVLGFLDCMKGEEVNDDDAIPSDMAEPLATLAAGCIDNAAGFIAEVIVENPSAVFGTVYQAGYDVCAAMNAAYGPTEINLN